MVPPESSSAQYFHLWLEDGREKRLPSHTPAVRTGIVRAVPGSTPLKEMAWKQ